METNKPFLTEDGYAQLQIAWQEEIDNHRAEDMGYIPAMFKYGFKSGFDKANAKIEQLETKVKEQNEEINSLQQRLYYSQENS